MKLGIVLPTYQKIDGTTPSLLKRAIESIKAQTHQDYSLIVIGDKYEDAIELETLLHSLELGEKLTYRNLPEAVERSKYPVGSKELWNAGGVNATNYGVALGLELGLTYICHLDHDDYWHPQHLEALNSAINQTENAALITTCSTYFNSYLPKVDLTNEIYSLEVKGGSFIHSAVCINHTLVPLKYRDVYAETGKEYPADADLWNRIGSYLAEHNLNAYQISALTCYHPTEGALNTFMKTTKTN
jgi:glycosyltransferase involved in cell wall biosynthesis